MLTLAVVACRSRPCPAPAVSLQWGRGCRPSRTQRHRKEVAGAPASPRRVVQGSCLEELCFVWFSEEKWGRRGWGGGGEFCQLTFISLEAAEYCPVSFEGRSWATRGALSR